MVWMVNSKMENGQQILSVVKTKLNHRLQQAGLTITALLLVVTGLFSYAMPSDAAFLKSINTRPWETVKLPSDESPLDVDFLPENPEQGWIVGTNSSIFQTADGGATWQQKKLDLGTEKYRLTSVSFSGQEGWIAGQPSILLHTKDGGNAWERMPLSEKLPGSPSDLMALGPDSVEMVTDIGAIYQTQDAGRNWKAMVNDAFGVFKSLHRSDDGQYVAVSSRGNFFSTWKPGSTAWEPFNRNSSRRLQGMGFTPDNRLWMLARGGQLQFTNSSDPEDWQKAQAPESFNSWGFLDLGYRTTDELWVVGGSGTLLVSYDNGKNWKKDGNVEDVPANLYKIEFTSPDRGYILGQRGTFLRYRGQSV
ncbi:MAG: photosynthesis system II assembly factor Ycf48 [Cyanobacteria bacterium]|nr:photosynthesis system II assembly factor Ycf48 [Cyanobacteriota bacterium]